MVENSRRDRVGLGLIGLGPSWERQYRETLARLQSRLRIRLVYDPVEARARTVAGELGAELAGSLRQILTRKSLQGLLVLDPGWCGPGILSLVARSGKPAYLASHLLRHDFALREILNGSFGGIAQESGQTPAMSRLQIQHEPKTAGQPSFLGNGMLGSDGSRKHSNRADDQLMPELGLRFTPASCRLRELMATKLGTARQIVIECDLSQGLYEIAALADWCTHTMGQPPTLPARVTSNESELTSIEFDFPPPRESPSFESRYAQLQHRGSDDSPVRIDIACERGHAKLASHTRIVWRTLGPAQE